MAYHQRSASLPCLPTSSVEQSNVEQELQTLKASPSATIDAACEGLRRLGDVYSSVEEMMRLPSNQVGGLSSARQRKTVEDELDRSLELIDLCNAMQESLADLKMCVQELLRLVLKRGDGAAAAQVVGVEAFVRMAKKAQKPVRKTSCGKAATRGGGEGGEGCRLVRVMAEAREMAVSLLETTSRLLPKQIGGSSSSGASKWSLVSKRLQTRKVVCEEQQLRSLERSMGDLEDGIEFLFRRLIRSRVSLLNILSS